MSSFDILQILRNQGKNSYQRTEMLVQLLGIIDKYKERFDEK